MHVRIDKRRIGHHPGEEDEHEDDEEQGGRSGNQAGIHGEASIAFIPGNTVDSPEYGHKRPDESRQENRKANIHHPVGERPGRIPRHPLVREERQVFVTEEVYSALPVLAKDQVPVLCPRTGPAWFQSAWSRSRSWTARLRLDASFGTTEDSRKAKEEYGSLGPRSVKFSASRVG